MQSLILTVNATIPLFLIIALGYVLKLTGVLKSSVIESINTLNFKVFLPVMVVSNLYTTDIAKVWDTKVVLFSVGTLVLLFLALMLVIPLLEKDNKKRGVIIQSIHRSNYAFLGVPLATELCGPENVGPAILMLAVSTPIFNICAVIAFESFNNRKIQLRKVLLQIIRNPLIISPAIGLLLMLLPFKLPYVFEKAMSEVAKVSTPLALLVIGGYFNFKKIRGNGRQLFISMVGRQVIVPALFIPLAIFLGMRGVDLVVILTLYATPTAVSSFTMAVQLGGDPDLAGQVVVMQTIAAILVIFLWVLLLYSFALI